VVGHASVIELASVTLVTVWNIDEHRPTPSARFHCRLL